MDFLNRIILVGNSSSVADFKEEDYDTIIRFNHGIREKGRTDVWVDALLQHPDKLRWQYEKAGSPKILRLNAESRYRLSQMPSEWYPNTIFMSERAYKELRRSYPQGVKPSIGYVCIWYLLYVQNEQEITITGFDSGESSNRYTGEVAYTSHSWETEKLFLEQLIQDGLIKKL